MALRILPENWFDEATISVTPPAVTSMPLANLQSPSRDRLWRSRNAEETVIEVTWGGDVRPVSSWGIWGGDLIGAVVRVQMQAAGAEIYDSGLLDFFDFSGTGWGSFPWGGHPWGVDPADRTPRLAPLVRYFPVEYADYVRITFYAGGAMTNPYFEGSRIWLADYVEAPYNAGYGAAPKWTSGSKLRRTVGGTLQRLARARWRELRFDTVFATEADRAEWLDICAACPPDREIVLSLFPGELSRRERDFTVRGSLEVLNPMIWESHNFHRLQLAIVES